MVERRGEWTERYARCGELSWTTLRRIKGWRCMGWVAHMEFVLWFSMSLQYIVRLNN